MKNKGYSNNSFEVRFSPFTEKFIQIIFFSAIKIYFIFIENSFAQYWFDFFFLCSNFVKRNHVVQKDKKTRKFSVDPALGTRPQLRWFTGSHEHLAEWPNVRKFRRLAYEQMLLYTRSKDYSKPVMIAVSKFLYYFFIIHNFFIYVYIYIFFKKAICRELPVTDTAPVHLIF